MLSDVKIVKLDKKFQNNIINLNNEIELIHLILNNTFKKFVSEINLNTYDYALNVLPDDYIYIKNDIILTNGKYIRYLDMTKPMEITLRIGGFVKTDNGYSVTIICPNKEMFKINKKKHLFFSKISDTDRIRCAVNDYV